MTSYFFLTGKVKASKKLLSNPTNMNLIKELGKAEIFSAKYIKSAEEFIRSVVYAGEHLENFVDTKTKIYKNLKRKLSMVVPPETDWVELAMKKAHLRSLMLSPAKRLKPGSGRIWLAVKR